MSTTAPFALARPVNVDPIAKAQEFASLRSLADQSQLRKQEMQSNAVDLQAKQLALDQTKAINSAYMNSFSVDDQGKPQLDKNKLTSALAQGGHGAAIPGILENITKYEQGQANLSKTNTELAGLQTDHGGDIGAAVKAADYDPHLMMVLGQDSLNRGTASKANVGPLLQTIQQALQQDPTGASAKAITQKAADALIANSPKQQKLITERNAETRSQAEEGRKQQMFPPQLAETQAKASTAQAEADIKTRQAQAMTAMKPEDWDKQVDSVIPNAGKTADLNARTKNQIHGALQMGLPLTAVQAVIKDASDQIGKTETALRTAEATKQTKLEVNFGEAANKAGIQGQEKGKAAYLKSAQQFSDAQRVSGELQQFIDLAKSGNKAAGANLPLVGVNVINAVNGIKRINKQELEQFSGAGSLLDRIQGKIGKITKGQPFPEDVLNDISSLNQTLSQGSAKKHADDVDVINSTYGTTFKPRGTAQPSQPTSGQGGQAGKPQYKVGDPVMYQGKPHKISAIKPNGKLVLEQ